MELIGELIELISRRAGLDNVGEVGQSLKKTGRRSSDDTPSGRSPGEQVRDVLDVVGSDLLDFGQLVIAGMKRATGEGSPDSGTLFGHGHNGFNKASATLRSAVPDDRWDGTGSHAYADQNTRQQVRTEAMADADTAVHRVLFREALQINMRRAYLDDRSDFLAKTSYATFPLQFIPRYGEAAKLAIETAALQAALSLSAYEMYQLHSDVSANAAELREAIGRYSGVEDGADLPGTGVDFTPPPPPGGGAPPGTAPIGPPVTRGDGAGDLVGGGSGPAGGGGGGAGSGATMPGTLPEAPSVGPMLQPELPAMPTATPTSAAPAPMTGAPAPAGADPARAAGALASLVAPLAGLVTGAALAAAASQRDQEDNERSEDKHTDGGDDPTCTADDDGAHDQAEHLKGAAAGHREAGRAPVDVETESDPNGPEAPLTVKLNLDTSPGPSAGMSPQDTRLGEGVHVRG